ncbi:MAG: O-antigen ligase domain-containing protein [Planctomycetes bacterium]|nr:O-antigen ligase domain-containing protein [Planctomycetota bacterium]
MTIMVPIALFSWPIVALFLFAYFPARRAVCLSYLLAWMFLPTIGYDIPGLPDYTKATAASISVLLATMVFHSGRLTALRFSPLDLSMIIWCACPFASSMTNGLGPYDGLSAVVENIIIWGLPYLIGRIYLKGLEDLRELAVLFFACGLIYVPLCVFEMRMSPQLNQWIYGFGGTGIAYKELGSWGSRPYVFMANGLTLGMFMTVASLCGFWLWITGSVKKIRGYSAGKLVTILILTSLFCKNMGASSLMLAGILSLAYTKYRRSSMAVWLLIAAAPMYMLLRGGAGWSGESIAEIAGSIYERRGGSFQTRLENEDRLVEKAMVKPYFGWGRWGRSRVFNDEGVDITLTDGLWVIALGTSGLVGLVSFTAALLLPAIGFTRRYSAKAWLHPSIAPGGALAVLVTLYAIDCLFNAMLNPTYLLALGGLVTVVERRAQVAVGPARARTPRMQSRPKQFDVHAYPSESNFVSDGRWDLQDMKSTVNKSR